MALCAAVFVFDVCTSPLPARRVGDQIEFLGRSESGRFFNNSLATLQIPCGQCVECRLKRSREWAVRCMHEASLHADNCFLTLTYADDKLLSPSLKYKDFQGFMKRLRKRFPNDRIGFFACGEYGETNPVTKEVDGGLYRPHFHALLFNFNFPDRVPCRMLGKADLEKSVLADSLWSHGAVKIGKVEFESASYVARYAMKKVTGAQAMWHYMCVVDDGEIVFREPEMLHMSKRPAIGRAWFEKFGKHAYAHDSVVCRGVEMQPPRYYDKLLPDVVRQMVVDQRIADSTSNPADFTDARNNVRAVVVEAGLKQFNRD